MRIFVVSAVLAFGMVVGVSPAHASCQTNPDVGDICKVIDAPCNSPFHKLWDLVTHRCS